MKNDLIAVFTGKNLANGMASDGGSGHWAAKKERVVAAKYLLCVRNRRESWAEADYEHGTAFLVARIVGTSPSEYPGRIIINFDEYAEIEVRDAWHLCTEGQRYPVAYLDSDEVQGVLGLDFKSLHWKKFGAPVSPDEHAIEQSKSVADRRSFIVEPIQAAKAMLSVALNVPEESIEIVVKF